MRFSVEIESDADLDFGTVHIVLESDDEVMVNCAYDRTQIALPLFNHEAAQLIEILQPIADLEDLT